MTSFPVKCLKCGATYDRKSWQRLPPRGVFLDCLEVRVCSCGEDVAAEVDGYGGANDHAGATRNIEDATGLLGCCAGT